MVSYRYDSAILHKVCFYAKVNQTNRIHRILRKCDMSNIAHRPASRTRPATSSRPFTRWTPRPSTLAPLAIKSVTMIPIMRTTKLLLVAAALAAPALLPAATNYTRRGLEQPRHALHGQRLLRVLGAAAVQHHQRAAHPGRRWHRHPSHQRHRHHLPGRRRPGRLDQHHLGGKGQFLRLHGVDHRRDPAGGRGAAGPQSSRHHLPHAGHGQRAAADDARSRT